MGPEGEESSPAPVSSRLGLAPLLGCRRRSGTIRPRCMATTIAGLSRMVNNVRHWRSADSRQWRHSCRMTCNQHLPGAPDSALGAALATWSWRLVQEVWSQVLVAPGWSQGPESVRVAQAHFQRTRTVRPHCRATMAGRRERTGRNASRWRTGSCRAPRRMNCKWSMPSPGALSATLAKELSGWRFQH